MLNNHKSSKKIPKRSTLNTQHSNDSAEYLAKKSFYDKVLTIYGRNAVLEALGDPAITIHKLHLSRSNRPSPQLDEMQKIARERGIEIAMHEKSRLSRISRNAKQDQGVALDLLLEHYMDIEEYISTHERYRLIALDSIHNPQNLGMIIRSCAAGNIDGIILPQKNAAKISPLVIKASAGTLFKIPIIKTDDLIETLEYLQSHTAKLYMLSSHSTKDYREESYPDRTIFVLGNESDGVSGAVETLCDEVVSIPMQRGVESLNVAVAAALLAFL